jgi:hypothetical protein
MKILSGNDRIGNQMIANLNLPFESYRSEPIQMIKMLPCYPGEKLELCY